MNPNRQQFASESESTNQLVFTPIITMASACSLMYPNLAYAATISGTLQSEQGWQLIES